jgi:hypothetical protein
MSATPPTISGRSTESINRGSSSVLGNSKKEFVCVGVSLGVGVLRNWSISQDPREKQKTCDQVQKGKIYRVIQIYDSSQRPETLTLNPLYNSVSSGTTMCSYASRLTSSSSNPPVWPTNKNVVYDPLLERVLSSKSFPQASVVRLNECCFVVIANYAQKSSNLITWYAGSS